MERQRLYPTFEEYGQYKKALRAFNGRGQFIDVDKLETTKEEFEGLLKKASNQKPKPSPKSSKT
jgi:hypothetical protein